MSSGWKVVAIVFPCFTHTGSPLYSASTWMLVPVLTICGARINTSSSRLLSNSHFTTWIALCNCRPYAFRLTVISNAPRQFWVGFSTAEDSNIAPAHVPKHGFLWVNCCNFSQKKPSRSSNSSSVVDSPPGIINASIVLKSSAWRINLTLITSCSKDCWCASKLPCNANTPTVKLAILMRHVFVVSQWVRVEKRPDLSWRRVIQLQFLAEC